jgi:hypothetical protein
MSICASVSRFERILGRCGMRDSIVIRAAARALVSAVWPRLAAFWRVGESPRRPWRYSSPDMFAFALTFIALPIATLALWAAGCLAALLFCCGEGRP